MDETTLRAIAKRHGALSNKAYAAHADFEPHQWVIDAMAEVKREAYDDGYHDATAECDCG
jgi:hypothetical protein